MASSIYEQYQNLTPKEQMYFRARPNHILSIKKAKEKAFEQTIKYFGINGRNDKSDAFRHCFWAAILSRELGYYNALQFTNAHESDPKNPSNEKQMDLHNNAVGLSIGRCGGSDNYLVGRCITALKNGRLKVIKK